MIGLTGRWTTGGMEGMMGSESDMMGGGWGMWWGPTVIFALIGVVLHLASRPLGAVMSQGLEK